MRKVGVALVGLLVAGCAVEEPSFHDRMSELEHARQTAGVGGIDDPDRSLIKIAEYFRDRGEKMAAIAFYRRALESSGERAMVRNIARNLMALDAYDDAASAYRRVIAEDDDDHEARLGLGLALLQSGRIENGVDHFRRLTETPGHFTIDSCRLYGTALDLRGEHVDAQGIYERCLGLTPDDIGVRGNLALSQVLSGKHEAAIATSVGVVRAPGASRVHVRNHLLVLALAGMSNDAERLGNRSLGETETAGIVQAARRILAIEDPAERARSVGLTLNEMER